MKKQNTTVNYKKILAIILIYAYIILAHYKVLGLQTFQYAVAAVILIWTIYSEWRIEGKTNKNSFEYLWINNKKEFICNFLIVLSIIIAILI